MAKPPRSAASNEAKAPDSLPIGVRAPARITEPAMCLPPRVTMWWPKVTGGSPRPPKARRAPQAGLSRRRRRRRRRGCGPGGGGRVVELEEPATAVEAHPPERRVGHGPVGDRRPARRPGLGGLGHDLAEEPVEPADRAGRAPSRSRRPRCRASSRGCSPSGSECLRAGSATTATRRSGWTARRWNTAWWSWSSDGVARRQPLIIPPSSTASVVAVPSVSGSGSGTRASYSSSPSASAPSRVLAAVARAVAVAAGVGVVAIHHRLADVDHRQLLRRERVDRRLQVVAGLDQPGVGHALALDQVVELRAGLGEDVLRPRLRPALGGGQHPVGPLLRVGDQRERVVLRGRRVPGGPPRGPSRPRSGGTRPTTRRSSGGRPRTSRPRPAAGRPARRRPASTRPRPARPGP